MSTAVNVNRPKSFLDAAQREKLREREARESGLMFSRDRLIEMIPVSIHVMERNPKCLYYDSDKSLLSPNQRVLVSIGVPMFGKGSLNIADPLPCFLDFRCV